MKDRFHNPFDGSRKRSAPQPHKLEKDKEKYKPTIYFLSEESLDWWDRTIRDYYKKSKEEE